MKSQKSSTSLNPASGELGRTVEKYSNTKRITKRQHITQSLLYRWELGRTVEKTLRHVITKSSITNPTKLWELWVGTVEKYSNTCNTKKGHHKEQHHSIPAS
jgi:hypothetical protein